MYFRHFYPNLVLLFFYLPTPVGVTETVITSEPLELSIRNLILARKPCFATFAGVGGGLVRPPPLAFPNEAS